MSQEITYTCIVCPGGCEITAVKNASGDDWILSGASCRRGDAYVRQELTDPRRTFSTLVRILDGEREVAGVRVTKPIPLGKVKEVAAYIHSLSFPAPVKTGQVLLEGILGMDCDLVAVHSVQARRTSE